MIKLAGQKSLFYTIQQTGLPNMITTFIYSPQLIANRSSSKIN